VEQHDSVVDERLEVRRVLHACTRAKARQSVHRSMLCSAAQRSGAQRGAAPLVSYGDTAERLRLRVVLRGVAQTDPHEDRLETLCGIRRVAFAQQCHAHVVEHVAVLRRALHDLRIDLARATVVVLDCEDVRQIIPERWLHRCTPLHCCRK
jgi:hypothetical protein